MNYSVTIIDEDGNAVYDRDIQSEAPELLKWWVDTAVSDFVATTPKIQEYGTGSTDIQGGSSDLRAIGDSYAELLGWPANTPSALRQQLAAWTYAVGKLGRGIANLKEADWIKPDTTFDLTVYAMMMRRLAEHGNWP